MDTPIDFKAGIALLEKMNLIEFAVQAAIIGDNGPLTSSPIQRRNMSLLLADVASTFAIIATRIDPLEGGEDLDAVIRWEATRAALMKRLPKMIVLPDHQPVLPDITNAFEESMERVGTEKYLQESNA
jgi:hypothetical protein